MGTGRRKAFFTTLGAVNAGAESTAATVIIKFNNVELISVLFAVITKSCIDGV